MAQKSIQSNKELAQKIRLRRNELDLTIAEAASRAGVGIKTWCRYEAGESIRKDKCRGICKALSWRDLPDDSNPTKKDLFDEYRDHEAWSSFLADRFGIEAAMSFAAGSDILYDHIKDDLLELSSMPAGSHIGQLSISCLVDSLPAQFLMRYDYEFLYQLKCSLEHMRQLAKCNLPLTAHSVIEELIIYLCNEEASVLIELSDQHLGNEETVNDSSEWVFDLFGDMDIISYLYSNFYLDPNHPYHFAHWTDQQFYTD